MNAITFVCCMVAAIAIGVSGGKVLENFYAGVAVYACALLLVFLTKAMTDGMRGRAKT